MGNLNNLYLRSLVARFKCVRDIINIKRHGLYPLFNVRDKFGFVFNLQFYFNSSETEFFIISKRKSLSFFFEDFKIYNLCLRCLFLESILPITEFVSDRAYIMFRPYRYCQDVFLNVKNLFFSKVNFPWVIKMELFPYINTCTWLSKNFPFFKSSFKTLYKWNANNIKDKFIFTIINFLLNGLV
jgi:hypothetical protein